jgi:hypothetical protein
MNDSLDGEWLHLRISYSDALKETIFPALAPVLADTKVARIVAHQSSESPVVSSALRVLPAVQRVHLVGRGMGAAFDILAWDMTHRGRLAMPDLQEMLLSGAHLTGTDMIHASNSKQRQGRVQQPFSYAAWLNLRRPTTARSVVQRRWDFVDREDSRFAAILALESQPYSSAVARMTSALGRRILSWTRYVVRWTMSTGAPGSLRNDCEFTSPRHRICSTQRILFQTDLSIIMRAGRYRAGEQCAFAVRGSQAHQRPGAARRVILTSVPFILRACRARSVSLHWCSC